MSVFNEKLRVLLHNQGWTQKELSIRLNVQPTTVQKWCAGKNQPDIKTIKALSAIFCVSYDTLLNDDQDVTIYYIIDRYLPFSQRGSGDSEHTIIDADLASNARLHRFTNRGGAECSAIYVCGRERWWHYRDHEARMIRDWNEYYRDKEEY